MPRSIPVRRTCLLLVMVLLCPLVRGEATQSLGLGGARIAQAKKGTSTPEASEAPKPQLLNADTNPTLRYPVSVYEASSSRGFGAKEMFSGGARSSSSFSCGWFDLMRSGALYTVVVGGARSKPSGGARFLSPHGSNYLAPQESEGGSGGFEASSTEISGAELVKGALLIYTSGRKIYLAYSPQSQWGTTQNQRAFFELAQQNVAGTTALQRAMQNFDGVLATVKPPAPPPLEVALHAEPSSVEKGRTVSLVWTSSNATTLDLEPGIGPVAAAGGISRVPQESTNYTLTATGPGGTKTASVFVTVTPPTANFPPTIVLMEPSAASEGQTVQVTSSPLIIRGVAMDASGIPVVTINGKPASMRPTSALAAQFTSDPLTLQPGENHIEVRAINSAQGQARVAFVAYLSTSPPKPQPAPPSNSKGLSKAEILSLLQGEVPSARVADLVKERGVRFVPTPDDLQEIRSAGGDDDLIDAINQASPSAK